MKKSHKIVLPALVFVAGCFCTWQLNAAILEYQIRRLILFKTECQIVSVTKSQDKNGSLNYHTKCENVSFYPDGVSIICTDPDQETSCKIMTKKKSFESLDLLKRSVNNKHEDDK